MRCASPLSFSLFRGFFMPFHHHHHCRLSSYVIVVYFSVMLQRFHSSSSSLLIRCCCFAYSFRFPSTSYLLLANSLSLWLMYVFFYVVFLLGIELLSHLYACFSINIELSPFPCLPTKHMHTRIQ